MLKGTQGEKRGRMSRAGAFVFSAALLIGSLAGAGASSSTALKAAGSVEQVYVTDLAPGSQASLLTPQGTTLATQTANFLGGMLFRNVPPGEGYIVKDAGGNESAPLAVHDDDAA